MDKLDFNNSLYYLLMDHADIADETHRQRLLCCSIYQMFDVLLRDQEPETAVFDSPYFKRGVDNDK